MVEDAGYNFLNQMVRLCSMKAVALLSKPLNYSSGRATATMASCLRLEEVDW